MNESRDFAAFDLAKLKELAYEAREARHDYVTTLPHNEHKAQRLSTARARLCSYVEPFDFLCDLVDVAEAALSVHDPLTCSKPCDLCDALQPVA